MNVEKFKRFVFGVLCILLILYTYQSFINTVDSSRTSIFLFSMNALALFGLFLSYIILKFKDVLFSKIYLLREFRFWFIGVVIVNISTSFVVTRTFTEIIVVTLPTLSFFTFYLFFRKTNIVKYYLYFAVFLTLFLIILYFNDYKLTNSELSDIKASLNVAYFPFLMLPTILLIKRPQIKFLLILLISIVIFSSMKRAGLLAFFIAIFVYSYVEYILIRGKRFKISSLLFVIIFLSVFIFGFLYVDNLNDGFFTSRIQNISQDEGSGRLSVYKDVFDLIKKSNFNNILLGNGENAVMKNTVTGYSAHNDFLEVFYNYGLIMLVVYFFIHIKLIKVLIVLTRQKSYFAAPFAVSYVQFMVFSLISHIIVYPYFILMSSFWGIVLGSHENRFLRNK